MNKVFCFIIYLFLLLTSSCTILGFGKAPYSECCNFNPTDCEINVTCKEEKIRAVKILLVEPGSGKFSPVYYENTYSNPVNEVTISTPLDSVIKSKIFLIKIWTNTHVIDDYRIEVRPSDWQNKKLIYGVYNYR